MHSDLIDFIVVYKAKRLTDKKINGEASKNCYEEVQK